jgi:hypothetical protein
VDPARLDGKKTEGINPAKSNWANPIDMPPFLRFPDDNAFDVHLRWGEDRRGGARAEHERRSDPWPICCGRDDRALLHEYLPATSVLWSNTFERIIGTNLGKELSKRATPATS